MEAERIIKYKKVVTLLEEPIRGIVPPLWDLPFVIDTGYTCSGHIIVENQFSVRGEEYPPNKSYLWYPREPRLEFAFSIEPYLTEARDNFRVDLRNVSVEFSGVGISFDKISTYSSNYLPYSQTLCVNLYESYRATIPKLYKTEKSVLLIESLLTSFWEEVAKVVRIHNPRANIGSIKDNFREVINWDHWRLNYAK